MFVLFKTLQCTTQQKPLIPNFGNLHIKCVIGKKSFKVVLGLSN